MGRIKEWFFGKPNKATEDEEKANNQSTPSNTRKSIPPGRVSVPNDTSDLLSSLSSDTRFVDTTFHRDYIPAIRKLYKVNPDMSIVLQDTFKLANTGHHIDFPYNSDEEAQRMEEHLSTVTKKWSNYTAGVDGLVNKMIVQCLVAGAISIEGVPSQKIDGVSTVLFIKPEEIYFKREANGVYHPYQINKTYDRGITNDFIKLNTSTYKYIATYGDTDEPNGVPLFMAALAPIITQKDMKVNFDEIMSLVGMLGFLEVKTAKPSRLASESEPAYQRRLDKYLIEVKKSVKEGMKDGVVVGYDEDHDFKLNSTPKDAGNVDKLWNLNQQHVANGLSTTGPLIGVNGTTTEGGTGILLSKLISQLKNIQTLVSHALVFLYELELKLAGFNCKGVTITFNKTTIADDVKFQQAMEYKIRNLTALYNQGIISQKGFARETGHKKPHLAEPRPQEIPGENGIEDSKKKKERKDDKSRSDRSVRDKEKTNPKRAEQDPRPR